MKTPVNSVSSGDYENLLHRLSDTYLQGRQRAVQAVNSHLIETYWQIGQYIVEFEQAGEARAIYGKALLEALARDLTLRHGKGFSRSNLNRFRQFYTVYPICAKASHKLSWSHYVELIKLDDDLERSFYEKQAIGMDKSDALSQACSGWACDTASVVSYASGCAHADDQCCGLHVVTYRVACGCLQMDGLGEVHPSCA